MALQDHKRMRLDTPSSSRISMTMTEPQPHYTLKICENRNEGKIVELHGGGYGFEHTAKMECSDFVDDIFFQDNTLAFKTILEPHHRLVLVIYPPGSGKTTMGLLLQSYLSANTTWSEKLTTFFENCKFAETYKADYNKFRKSGNVAYINFEDMDYISNPVEFEQSLADIMLDAFEMYCSESRVRREEAILEKSRGNVYGSLLRFSTELYDDTKTTYILLDSLDIVYDTIAQLDMENANVCKEFTRFLQRPISDCTSRIMLLCFGVSPYFAREFPMMGIMYEIGCKNSDLGTYFSYSEDKIGQVISKLNLKTSVNECRKIAELKYNNNSFINPSICVSFLRSLYLKRNWFRTDVIPRSLWLRSIFTNADRDLLLDVLNAPSAREFKMYISINDIIGIPALRGRNLYYQLLIYGGFLSYKLDAESNQYIVSAANQVSKCILHETVKKIHFEEEYKRALKECGGFYQLMLAGLWQEVCDAVSAVSSSGSSKNLNQERDYNFYFFGLLNSSILKGCSFERKVTIKNNKPSSGILPDLIISDSGIAVVWELKIIRATVLRKELKEDLSLEECYLKDITQVHKETVWKTIKKKLRDAKTQLVQYASTAAVAEKFKSLKCFIIIFYLHHVILYANDSFFQNRDGAKVGPSTWKMYCSNGFFCEEQVKNLTETADI